MDRSLPFPAASQGPGRADKLPGHGARIPPGSLVPPALCPGEAPAPRADATAGVGRDLELWPHNTAARSLPGFPLLHSRPGGRELNSTFGGFPASWPYFPWLRGLGAGGGGECQPGLLDTGPRPQLPSTGGCHSATEQPGIGRANPRLTPVCPPAPCWDGSGSRLVALGATLVAAGSAPGSVSERGWGLAWGALPGEVLGRRGPRARRGWAVPASPASPLLSKHARPEKAVPAGSGRPGPCATRARDSLARGLAPRAGSRAPHPARVPQGCSPGQQPPTMGPAGPRSRRHSTIGSCLGAAAPAAWAAHSCPRPPLRPRGSGGPNPAPGSPRPPPRGRGDTGPRCPSSGARCQSGSSFAGVRAGGATVQETHRKLLGTAAEINGGRRIRGVSCGGRSSMSQGGEEGSGTR